MKRFFTADYHLGHFNIIKYCGRPFKTLEEMNETIIRNHNERVKEGDEIYYIGDFCFKNSLGGKPGEGTPNKASEYLKRLNGRFIFIKGNHDRNNSLKIITESASINYGGKRVYLVHNPDFVSTDYDINFVGHIHQHWKFKRIRRGERITDCINVGVDVNDFKPKTFEELISGYYKWKKENKYK